MNLNPKYNKKNCSCVWCGDIDAELRLISEKVETEFLGSDKHFRGHYLCEMKDIFPFKSLTSSWNVN